MWDGQSPGRMKWLEKIETNRWKNALTPGADGGSGTSSEKNGLATNHSQWQQVFGLKYLPKTCLFFFSIFNDYGIMYIQRLLTNPISCPVNAFQASDNSRSNRWPAFKTENSWTFTPLDRLNNGFCPTNWDKRFCLLLLIRRISADESEEKITLKVLSPEVHTKACGSSNISRTCNFRS